MAGPRPEVLPDHDFYELLVAYDRPLNSMPSLHAGLVVYSLLFANRVTRSTSFALSDGDSGRRAGSGAP